MVLYKKRPDLALIVSMGINAALVLMVLLMMSTPAPQPVRIVQPKPYRADAADDKQDGVSNFLSSHDKKCHDWITGKGFQAAAKRSPSVSDKTTLPSDEHSFEAMYEKYLSPFRCWSDYIGQKVKLMEIGVGSDGEMRGYKLFREYLGKKLDYYGFDFTNHTHKILQSGGLSPKEKKMLMSRIALGEQTNVSALAAAYEKWGSMDVIVDDASHDSSRQIPSFEHLFLNCLAPGGVYIIEDLQTSFFPRFQGGIASQVRHNTTVSMIRDLITAQHFHWWNHPKYNRDVLENVYGQEIEEGSFVLREKIVEWVQTVDCDREICVIRKRKHILTRRKP